MAIDDEKRAKATTNTVHQVRENEKKSKYEKQEEKKKQQISFIKIICVIARSLLDRKKNPPKWHSVLFADKTVSMNRTRITLLHTRKKSNEEP